MGILPERVLISSYKMKVFNILLGFGLVSQSDAQKKVNSAEQKFKHLNKVYPQMLELFFEDGGAENAKAAARVASRYKDNFAVKHLQLQQLWDACPEADMDNIIERIDLEDSDRFDHTYAKKAFNQITNGYKQLLEAMARSGCRKQNRYQALIGRFDHIANMLKFHYCDKVDTQADWCLRHQ